MIWLYLILMKLMLICIFDTEIRVFSTKNLFNFLTPADSTFSCNFVKSYNQNELDYVWFAKPQDYFCILKKLKCML